MPRYHRFDELTAFVAAGMCTRRRHPDPELPIWIYNYSSRAQFEFTAISWPEALREARGLVLDEEGNLIARGLPKFFNLSQLTSLPAGTPEFWEKADGSLILVFQHAGRRICSTRGSFDSPQAEWAHGLLAAQHPDFMPIPGITYCLEAIYPGNRIVVDYAGKEELVLLAAIDSISGLDRDEALAEVQDRFRKATFYGQLDAASIPVNEGEGFVLRWPDGTRAKVKLDEYTRVHRLIFGTSTKTIWALLRAGRSPEEQASILPREMREWISSYADELRALHATIVREQLETFAQRPDNATRPEFAEWAKRQRHPKFQFKLLDGRAIEDDVWRMIEPEFAKPKWAQEPDE